MDALTIEAHPIPTVEVMTAEVLIAMTAVAEAVETTETMLLPTETTIADTEEIVEVLHLIEEIAVGIVEITGRILVIVPRLQELAPANEVLQETEAEITLLVAMTEEDREKEVPRHRIHEGVIAPLPPAMIDPLRETTLLETEDGKLSNY